MAILLLTSGPWHIRETRSEVLARAADVPAHGFILVRPAKGNGLEAIAVDHIVAVQPVPGERDWGSDG